MQMNRGKMKMKFQFSGYRFLDICTIEIILNEISVSRLRMDCLKYEQRLHVNCLKYALVELNKVDRGYYISTVCFMPMLLSLLEI